MEYSSGTELGSILDWVLQIAGALVLIAMVVAIGWIVQKLRDANHQIEYTTYDAERQFEQAELEAIGATPPSTPQPLAPLAPPRVPQTLPPSAPPFPPQPQNPPGPPFTPQPIGPVAPSSASAPPVDRLQSAAARLQALGILTHAEGRISLTAPPDGLLYRMKRGGLCAILPRAEAEPVLVHLSRRFDLLVIVTPEGELLTCERFQSRLPDLTGNVEG